MLGYPRWVRTVALPVSCYRVSPSRGPCPIRWGQLVVQRRTPRVPEGFSSGCQGIRWALVARRLPTVGSHLETSLPVSNMT